MAIEVGDYIKVWRGGYIGKVISVEFDENEGCTMYDIAYHDEHCTEEDMHFNTDDEGVEMTRKMGIEIYLYEKGLHASACRCGLDAIGGGGRHSYYCPKSTYK